jgi:hypothetical protein
MRVMAGCMGGKTISLLLVTYHNLGIALSEMNQAYNVYEFAYNELSLHIFPPSKW